MEKEIPDFLKELLNKQYDENDVEKIIQGYTKKRPVTLRVNTLKSNKKEVLEELNKLDVKITEVQWNENAFILEGVNESDISKLDIYEQGKIYLQSLSSMLPPIVLNAQENQDILDMAAAPGGKTTQIAALTNNNANITACELNTLRAERLKYNIEKQGASSVYVMVKDARTIDDFFSFDNILLDAPCSGSGTLDLSNPDTFKYFTMKLIDKSKKAQLALLRKALKILKPGKEMIYSTCSILEDENENILKQVIKNGQYEILPIEFEGMEKLPLLPVKIPGVICVCPNELYEGFFIAKIRRVK